MFWLPCRDNATQKEHAIMSNNIRCAVVPSCRTLSTGVVAAGQNDPQTPSCAQHGREAQRVGDYVYIPDRA